MSLRTKFNPMGSLGVKYYTLTIITSPSDSTVTLTYNNVNYNTQSLKVEAGSTVSYSIYHSTYGTKTGSIIMTSDKTITATGTSSSIETSYAWTQPKLRANGTMGGSSFACTCSSEYSTSTKAFKALDSSSSTQWQTKLNSSNTVRWITFYNPTPICVTKVICTTLPNTSNEGTKYHYQINAATLQGSNDNGTWTNLGSISGVGRVATATITASGNTNYYKYHRIYASKTNYYAAGGGIYYAWYCSNIAITATYLSTTFSYDWNINIT